MLKLSPSILAADFANLENDIHAADMAGADMIHLDVMDGMFVSNISFGIPVIKSLRKTTGKVFDVHLMIEEPIRYIDEFASAGADIITVHYEACSNIKETIGKIKEAGCRVGLAINPDTDADVVVPYIKSVDMVLVMTVYPGFGGQKYIDNCSVKCTYIKDAAQRMNTEIDIEVDGGIGADNVHIPIEAGANVIVAGSSVFKGDVSENINKIKSIFEKFTR